MQLISNIPDKLPATTIVAAPTIIDGSHFKVIRDLLSQADDVILVSPFLYSDFETFFSGLMLPGLKTLTIVTTCRPDKDDQLEKPFSIKSFTENLKSCSPVKWPTIHIDQKLHGKIYLFKKDGNYLCGIVTSANLTAPGLNHNHEWGILVRDVSVLSLLEHQVLSSVDYVSITEHQLNLLCVTAETFKKDPKAGAKDPVKDVDIGLGSILNNYCTPSAGNKSVTLRKKAKFFIKVSGVRDHPILPEHRTPFNEPHAVLDFAKNPKGIEIGDCLIEVAVGGKCFLSYYACASAVYERTPQEKALNPDHKRWPFYVFANNLSLAYGSTWFDAPLYYDEILKEFKAANKGLHATPSGKDDLKGPIQMGHSYFSVTEEFGKFVKHKIDEYIL